MAVLRGEIEQSQIRGHEDRNRLLKAIGSEGKGTPECSGTVDLSGGEHAFLLCSDGFWENVLEEEMEAALQNAYSAKDWMRDMCVCLEKRKKANCDNNTAVAVICYDI